MSTSTALRNLYDRAYPLVEQWLDLADEFAALRDEAREKGLDWSQIKALVKAQAQDERDGGDGKRVERIINKAEFASAYADMLGLAKMNKNNFSDTAGFPPGGQEAGGCPLVPPVRSSASTSSLDEPARHGSAEPAAVSEAASPADAPAANPLAAARSLQGEAERPARQQRTDARLDGQSPGASQDILHQPIDPAPPTSTDDEPELPAFLDRRQAAE